MLKKIDSFLNTTTTYRLVLYHLTLLVAVALLESLFGIIPYGAFDLLFSVVLLVAVCFAVNTACAKLVGAVTNVESVYITAFILALIMNPVAPTDGRGILVLVLAATLAMGSKYVLALDKKHFLNPAAFGVALLPLLGVGSASWWVGGNLPLLPFVLVGGVLVVRKMRRADLVGTFVIVALVTIVLTSAAGDVFATLHATLLYGAFLFLATVMLTEPATMPPTHALRMVYGAIVAILYAPAVHLGPVYLLPEQALLVGNLFALLVSSRGRYTMRLVEKHLPVASIDEFVFVPDRPVAFKPGQYLEWTLPHSPSDARGNRRYFTIASSPTEKRIRLGIKFYEPASSFKRALGSLKINDTISAAGVAGDFTLPRNTAKKLAFIAGGIGVTPFRSHVQYVVDREEQRDIVLLYASKPDEIVYRDLFDRAAQAIGMRTVYIPGMIDTALIKKEIPDYKERTFYLSGPPGMVDAHKKALRRMGVWRFNIKTDYFPGFV